ncbi:DUF3149 domain-containing protein [Catenovulum adriaticum]|uniref:DUF3149 domain-containing protein n=1 Tax=Catenovulum adriaticum TaxID=2984846 RepID=A0ABY7AQ90_9ALTE|nr:DUF3149 domain-containing protein [Catenovulum sp. TS8]WAJ70917.1 DUF3149 domain-containing protein [Catenovulum sp. TS8]
MSSLQMLLADPVVWGSLLGLSIVLGLCGYYVWLFLTKIAHSDSEQC